MASASAAFNLGVPLVGAVAAEGESHLGDGAGLDLLGEVGYEGHASVDLGGATLGEDRAFAIPLDGLGGSVESTFLQDLIAFAIQIEVHCAGNCVALAGDNGGAETTGGAVVDDLLGLGGALDAGVSKRQNLGHAGAAGWSNAGGGAFLHPKAVTEGGEVGACGHDTQKGVCT